MNVLVKVLLLFFACVIMLITQGIVRNRQRYRDPWRARIILLTLGWAVILLGLVGVLYWSSLFLQDVLQNTGAPFDGILGFAASIVAAIALWGGIMTLGIAQSLVGGQLSPAEEDIVDRKLDRLSRIGWLLLFVSMPIPAALVLLGRVIVRAERRHADQAMLLWHLALAVENGLPLDSEVDALAENLCGKNRQRARDLAGRLRAGDPLAFALDAVPYLVPRSAAMAAHVGTAEGTLSHALRDEAVRCTRQTRLNRAGTASPTTVVLYFSSVVTVTGLIVTFIMYYIVPKLKKIFEDFGLGLPDVTITLIRFCDVFVNFFYLFLPLLAVPMFFAVVAAGVSYVGWENLEISWIRRWLVRLETPSLLRVLAGSVAAGRPLVEGLKTVANRNRCRHVRRRVGSVLLATERGENCWKALAKYGFVSRRESSVLESAQRVGNLPWALRDAADAFERRLWYRLAVFADVARVAGAIVVGLAVGFVCVGIFVPLVRLLNALS